VFKKLFGASLITRFNSYPVPKPVQKSKKIFFEILSGMIEDDKKLPEPKFGVNRTDSLAGIQNRKPVW
jgi:hypothetical protein